MVAEVADRVGGVGIGLVIVEDFRLQTRQTGVFWIRVGGYLVQASVVIGPDNLSALFDRQSSWLKAGLGDTDSGDELPRAFSRFIGGNGRDRKDRANEDNYGQNGIQACSPFASA